MEEATESFLLAEKKLHAVKANVEVSEIDGTLRDPKVACVLVAADAAVRAAKRKLQGITAAATNNAMPSSPSSSASSSFNVVSMSSSASASASAAAAVEDPRVPNARAVLASVRVAVRKVDAAEDATEREKTRLRVQQRRLREGAAHSCALVQQQGTAVYM